MKNGTFLKNVNSANELEEQSEFAKKMSGKTKKESNEVSKIIYIQSTVLLIAAYYDSTIRIYDE